MAPIDEGDKLDVNDVESGLTYARLLRAIEQGPDGPEADLSAPDDAARARLWARVQQGLIEHGVLPAPSTEQPADGSPPVQPAVTGSVGVMPLQEQFEAARDAATEAAWQAMLLSYSANRVHAYLTEWLAATMPAVAARLRPFAVGDITVIIPVSDDVVGEVGEDERRLAEAFHRALAGSARKITIGPVFDVPLPSDRVEPVERFSAIIQAPLAIDPARLVLCLCPTTAPQIGVPHRQRAIGLVLPQPVPEGGAICRIGDSASERPDPASWPEPAIIAALLPLWCELLIEHVAAGAAAQHQPGLGHYLPPLPPPNLVVGHPAAARLSVLPQAFELIARTISPRDPAQVGVFFAGLNREATTLSIVAASEHFPWLMTPDVRLAGADGFDWQRMGLIGRVRLSGQQKVARLAHRDVPPDVRDQRVLYSDSEQLYEAVGTPVSGGYDAEASGERRPQGPGSVAGPAALSLRTGPHQPANVLYVIARQPGLLTPLHVLWLRDVAVLLGRYTGMAAAQRLANANNERDRDAGGAAILGAVDTERPEALRPLLRFVSGATKTPRAGRSFTPAATPDVLPDGLTFIHYLGGAELFPAWHHAAHGRERRVYRLLDAIREHLALLQEDGWLWSNVGLVTAAVPYRHGVLAALRPAPNSNLSQLAAQTYRHLARCQANWNIPTRPGLSACLFHRSFAELQRIRFSPEEDDQHLVYALRRLDPPMRAFLQRLRQYSLAGRDEVPAHVLVFREDYWTPELVAVGPTGEPMYPSARGSGDPQAIPSGQSREIIRG